MNWYNVYMKYLKLQMGFDINTSVICPVSKSVLAGITTLKNRKALQAWQR